MSDKIITGAAAVLLAIVGLAIIAVLVSRNAQTGNVLTSGGSGFSKALAAALSPLGAYQPIESVNSRMIVPGA